MAASHRTESQTDFTAAVYGSLLATTLVTVTWQSDARAERVGLSLLVSVATFWIAHAWSRIVNRRVRGSISRSEVVELAREESPMLASAIVPAICLGLGAIGLLSIDGAFELALVASIVQLFLWGLAVGRAAHGRWPVALGVAFVDSALGLAVVALKVIVIH